MDQNSDHHMATKLEVFEWFLKPCAICLYHEGVEEYQIDSEEDLYWCD